MSVHEYFQVVLVDMHTCSEPVFVYVFFVYVCMV